MTTYAARSGLDGAELEGAEHILIEDALANEAAKPDTLNERITITNPVSGDRLEISLYAEGLARIRQGITGRVARDNLIELQYVDPVCEQRTVPATTSFWLAGIAAALAGVSALALTLAGLSQFVLWSTGGLLVTAATALVFGLRHTVRVWTFSTMTGRVEVIRFVANIGCLRSFRAAADDVAAAIRGAGASAAGDDPRLLRAEMQAHYRLLESGLISRDACSEGTRRILARF